MLRRILPFLLFPFLANCETKEKSMNDKKTSDMPKVSDGEEFITLGAGCFWCIEAAYRHIPGVVSATSGYMGGKTENPTYEQICTTDTGHAEVVMVVFDPKKISLTKVLDWFWELHDPTSLNKQGADEGTQYRSAIFYNNDAQKKVVEDAKKDAQEKFSKPIVTEITKATKFYPAENYHQDYYFLNKNKNGYCRLVIEPKLKKLKLKH